MSALINESQPLQSPNSAESKNRQKCQKLIRGARARSSAPLQCIAAEIITFSSQINLSCYSQAAIKDIIVASRIHKVYIYVSNDLSVKLKILTTIEDSVKRSIFL